ncbi:hypothetical protein [Candidatus Protofrankia californiensis]|nr:hypothetical protein [Candidatus Protofrankia californiensis]
MLAPSQGMLAPSGEQHGITRGTAMEKLARSGWYDLARDTNWTFCHMSG